MQHTILTENNYKATIDIPLSKIKTKYKTNKQTREEDQFQQMILLPHCSCKQSKSRNDNNSVLQMISQLEKQYERDTQSLNNTINSLQKEILMNKKIQEDSEKLNQAMKGELQNSRLVNEKIQKQKYHLEVEIQQLKKDKENMMKVKIVEFQRNEIKNIEDNEVRIRMIAQQYRIQSMKQEMILQNQISEKNQIINGLKVQIQEQLKISHMMRNQLQTLTKSITLMNQQFACKERDLHSLVVLKEGRLQVIVKELQKIRRQSQSLQQILKQKDEELVNKNNQIAILKNQTISLSQKLQSLSEQYSNTLKQKNQELQLNRLLKIRIQEITSELLAKTNTIQTMIQRQTALKDQIKLLKEDKNKVYEVKIERVIDRKEYIQKLQVQIDNQNRQNTILKLEIAKLTKELQEKNKQLQESLTKYQKCILMIKQLRQYIEVREKSFAWTVQRQLQIDMESNIHNSEIGKIYKVHPIKQKVETMIQKNIRTEAKPYMKETIIIQNQFISENYE